METSLRILLPRFGIKTPPDSPHTPQTHKRFISYSRISKIAGRCATMCAGADSEISFDELGTRLGDCADQATMHDQAHHILAAIAFLPGCVLAKAVTEVGRPSHGGNTSRNTESPKSKPVQLRAGWDSSVHRYL